MREVIFLFLTLDNSSDEEESLVRRKKRRTSPRGKQTFDNSSETESEGLYTFISFLKKR